MHTADAHNDQSRLAATNFADDGLVIVVVMIAWIGVNPEEHSVGFVQQCKSIVEVHNVAWQNLSKGE